MDDAGVENVVKMHVSNLVLTGNAGNHGNFKAWRKLAIAVAHDLDISHISSKLAALRQPSSQSTPLEISDDEGEGDVEESGKECNARARTEAENRNYSMGSGDYGQTGASTSSSSIVLPLQVQARSKVPKLEDLHRLVCHVMAVYAFDASGGFLLDGDGLKAICKIENVPKLSSFERWIQRSALKALTEELVGGRKRATDIPEQFLCAICKYLLFEPVTTNCGHNFCRPCLRRWILKRKHTCPVCRNGIAKKWRMPVNKSIWNALGSLYPDQVEERRKQEREDELERRRETDLSTDGKKRKRRSRPGQCYKCLGEFSNLVVHMRICEGTGKRRRTLTGRSPGRTPTRTSTETLQSSSQIRETPRSTTNTKDGISETFTYITTADGRRQTGIMDSTAILHLPSGVTHAAKMELRRLTSLNKPLSSFHRRILVNLQRGDKGVRLQLLEQATDESKVQYCNIL